MDSREYNRHLLQEKLKEFSFPENEALWNRIEAGLSLTLPVQHSKTIIKIKTLSGKALTLKSLIATGGLSIIVTTFIFTNKHDHSTPVIKPSQLKTVPAIAPESVVKINNVTTKKEAARIESLVKRKNFIQFTPDSLSRINEPIIIKNLSSNDVTPNSLIDSIKPVNKNIISLYDTIEVPKSVGPVKEDDYYFEFQKKKKKGSKK